MKKEKIVSMDIPTEFGLFTLTVWPGERGRELVALSTLELNPSKEVMIRIHSECLTGDVFGSHTCDCGIQKKLALEMIQKYGNGVFIYHRQEGRNMGLHKKVQAYNLMQKGMDTHQANIALVGYPDGRNYSDVLTVLSELLGGRKSSIRLLSNNPYKKLFLTKNGYQVIAQPLTTPPTVHSAAYAETKEVKFLHGAHGNESYVGVTLYRGDIREAASLKKMLGALDLVNRGRHINLGVAVLQDKGDKRDQVFAQEINTFANAFAEMPETHIVLHTDYPATRSAYRDLQKFLASMTFPYSLQFRIQPGAELKVDTELIDSLHAERVIFQLRSNQFALLEQKDFKEYFSRPHRTLLLDESFGSGKKELFESTKARILSLVSCGMSRIAITGGYSSENVQEVFEFEDYFKIPISVDAETRLHSEGKLNLAEVEKYLWRIIHPTTAFSGLTFDQAIQVQKKIHQHGGATTFDLVIADDLTLKNFQVFEHVLNPLLVSDARLFAKILYEKRKEYAGKSVMDIGTGSGMLGVVMALGGVKHVICSDISPEAVANARANIAGFDLDGSAQAIRSDLFAGLQGKKVDIIVFNHPYFASAPIPEEKISLAMMDAGDLLQRFLKVAKNHLNPGGRIIMPYHEFAGAVNDPEKHAAQYGYLVHTERYETSLAFRNDAFKVCTLMPK
jgi:GTP cyclohydrolase II